MSRQPAPPAGPARMLASDADRERVATILRAQFEAGRLQEDELEQRLGRALAARRVGQLRELVSDLPAPLPTRGERVGHGFRWTGRVLWASVRGPVRAIVTGLLVIFVVLVVIGAIVGDQHGAGSSSSSDPEPPPADKITHVAAGRTGVDDNMAFRVRRTRTANSFPFRPDYGSSGSRLQAGNGEELAIVDVDATNHTGKPTYPFCGSNGARLYSRHKRGYDLVEDLYKLAGNDVMCSGGLQDDETAGLHLVFSVPKGTHPARLDVWNSDDHRDVLGHTRLRIPLVR